MGAIIIRDAAAATTDKQEGAMKQKEIERLIEQRYPKMSPQLQRAAQFTLTSPTDIALYPMRVVSKKANVSPTALVRLANQLGFDSYNDFRNEFRERITRSAGSSRYAEDAEDMIASMDGQSGTANLRRSIESMFRLMLDQFDEELLEKIRLAAQLIHQSETTYVIGFRNNFSASFFFSFVAQLVHSNIRLIDGSGGLLIDQLADIRPEDCALVLSYEPYAMEAVRATDIIRQAGAKFIALTDSPLSPIANGASHLLITSRVNISFYQSSIPTMLVLEAIVYFLMFFGGKDSAQRVRSEYEKRVAIGVFWNEGPNS